jgi:chromosome segregation ATPase
MRIAQQKKDLDSRKVSFSEREARLGEMISGLKNDAALQAERERDIQKKCAEELKQKDEKIQSLDTKVELLRGEVDRRDQLIKQFELAVSGNEKDKSALTLYVAELQRALKDKDLELQNQKTRFDILTNERDALREGWERERAEWRELWDRGREVWDKRG